MTYKEFLQALADAYKATEIGVGSGDAFMCLVLSAGNRTIAQEAIVARACNFDWNENEDHAEKLKKVIQELESECDVAWHYWAMEQYPDMKTMHQRRAHWLQIQADEA